MAESLRIVCLHDAPCQVTNNIEDNDLTNDDSCVEILEKDIDTIHENQQYLHNKIKELAKLVERKELSAANEIASMNRKFDMFWNRVEPIIFVKGEIIEFC